MPILVSETPIQLPTPAHIVLPTEVVSDAYALTWTAPDGTTWPLMDASFGWHLQDGLVGVLGAVPIAVTTDDDPGGGVTVRAEQPQARIMTLPLRIDGPDPDSHLIRFRQLIRSFTMTRRLGPGTLILKRPDGTLRQIPARYYAGLDPAPGGLSGWLYSDLPLQLLAPDPYWTDPNPIPITIEFQSGAAADFQNPYFTLSASSVVGDPVTVNNPGDAEAWPTWTITGPASLITATNNTTGKVWTIDPNAAGIAHGNLLAGETVTVTTRPQKVRGPDGTTPWTGALGFPDNADLWPLEPGDNSITVALAGAAAGSDVVGSFTTRWETP